jgi:hypothetical protein
MKLKTFLSSLAILALVTGYSQKQEKLVLSNAVSETQDINTEIVPSPEEKLTEKMSRLLLKKGKSLNIVNNDGSIYVIGTASCLRSSSQVGFINSRNIAYGKAELNAKMNLLNLVGRTITSGRGTDLMQNIVIGEDPDASSKASILQKVALAASTSMDKALLYLGISEEKISKMNEAQKNVVYKESFQEKVKSVTSGMVKGMAPVWIMEGNPNDNSYQVAICLKFSPEFMSLASMIKKNEFGSKTSTGEYSNIKKIIDTPIEKLIAQLGTKVMVEKNGELLVFGFGQQEINSQNAITSKAISIAYKQAKLKAINNIKYFVAEDIVAQEMQLNVEKSKEYSDGSAAYFSQDKYEQGIKSKSSTLKISNTEVRRWRGVHPVAKKQIAGVVVVWSLSNAIDALKVQKAIQASENSKTDGADKPQNTIFIEAGDEDGL